MANIPQRRRAMNDDVWDRKFKPVSMANSPGSLTRNVDELDPKYADPYHVWSIVDADNGKMYLLPGYHVVNVFGYAQTEIPWADADCNAGLTVLYST